MDLSGPVIKFTWISIWRNNLSSISKVKYFQIKGVISAFCTNQGCIKDEIYLYDGQNLDSTRPTSAALGRSLGSKARRRSSKRRAIGSIPGNFLVKGTRGFFLILLMYRRAFSFLICNGSIVQCRTHDFVSSISWNFVSNIIQRNSQRLLLLNIDVNWYKTLYFLVTKH